VAQGQATPLFAQEKQQGSLGGILGNVMQNVFGEEVYPSIEEKAANLLYFIIKNHPFNDGNKRTAAFGFIWFLKQSDYPFADNITPNMLTALTLFIAESEPKYKDRMIGLVLELLNMDFRV
jgi:death-on-curing family protein